MFPKITAMCPFCGMQPETEDDHAKNLHIMQEEIQGHMHYWVQCFVGCGTKGPVCADAVEAVNEWNKRATPS